jgi:putative peptidoglycan lipid II flippase
MITDSLIIKPFGAAGLAFSGTIGGFVLFFLTLRAFGFKRIIEMYKK